MNLRELITEYVADSFKPEHQAEQLEQFLSRLSDDVLATEMEGSQPEPTAPDGQPNSHAKGIIVVDGIRHV